MCKITEEKPKMKSNNQKKAHPYPQQQNKETNSSEIDAKAAHQLFDT